MNYQGKPRDVMTLAMNSVTACIRCWREERRADGADTLTLAETASVFGEMLTSALLAQTRSQTTPGAARRQGRGHDQHGGAADRVLFVRRAIHTERRNAIEPRAHRRNLAQRAGRKPRLRDRHPPRATRISGCIHSALIHSPFYVYGYRIRHCSIHLSARIAAIGLREPNVLAGLLAAGGIPDSQDCIVTS